MYVGEHLTLGCARIPTQQDVDVASSVHLNIVTPIVSTVTVVIIVVDSIVIIVLINTNRKCQNYNHKTISREMAIA